MDLRLLATDIEKAHERIKRHHLQTPLMESYALSKLCNCRVFLKLESEQYTGSFKLRGSLNKLLSLSRDELDKGLITASTGNHGLGFGHACLVTGASGTVFLPRTAAKTKVEALSHYPVKLEFVEGTSLDTELKAKQVAVDRGLQWVSPYNDMDIIAGQGTIGMEIMNDLPEIDRIYVTVGGGGMIAGIGAYLKTKKPDIEVISCQPKRSPEMTMSIQAGKLIELVQTEETLSDGSAGGIEPGAITFPICRRVIDRSILVDEGEIASAMRYATRVHHKIIEGAAGVALASLIQQKERNEGGTAVVVICGSNVSLEVLQTVLAG